MTSRSALEANVISERKALQASVSDLRARLTPAALSDEIGTTLSARAADVGQTLTDKAATPAGLVAVCAVAFSSAFAMSGGMSGGLSRSTADPKRGPAMDLRPAKMPYRAAAPAADTLKMLVQLSAAVAVGAVASRFIPATASERTILSGVGPELKRALQSAIHDQAQRLVAPKSGHFSLANVAAIAGAMILSRNAGKR